MTIEKNIQEINQTLKKYPQAKLIPATKKRTTREIQQLIQTGITAIGESRIQEAEQKFPELFKSQKTIQTHLIGHLQKNKIKKAIKLFDLSQTIDNLTLAQKINQESQKLNKIMPILIQINISNDPNKTGFQPTETIQICQEINKMSNLKLKGLMTIPKYETNPEKTRTYYKNLKNLFEQIKQKEIFSTEFKNQFTELSMGMSSDWQIALQEGATIIRIGSMIFN